ncbi:hypothetical protein SUGI_1082560 [Cryptomeria japonica]|nr:hypothetical protein SUGI_1082560 [Cryptomeria japonica]
MQQFNCIAPEADIALHLRAHRVGGKEFLLSIEQEATGLLDNLGWPYMQQSNYIAAEGVYRILENIITKLQGGIEGGQQASSFKFRFPSCTFIACFFFSKKIFFLSLSKFCT